MELWHAVILGLVEGITEYLPVSSTGHLILTTELLNIAETPEAERAVNAFNIVVQGGAILAVLGLYWPRVLQMLQGLIGKNPKGLRLWLNLLIAFLPAAVLGVRLDDWLEARLFNAPSVLTALALGGVFMIVLDRRKIRPLRAAGRDDPEASPGKSIDDLTWRDALIIGFLQCVAMWPGTSRSMMTISGGVLVGLRPAAAAEFSFLLGLPTLGGACAYKLLKNINDSAEAGEPNLFEALGFTPVLIGVVVATASAALAVKWLVGFLNKHGLEPFGWYRLALAAVMGGLIAAGLVAIG